MNRQKPLAATIMGIDRPGADIKRKSCSYGLSGALWSETSPGARTVSASESKTGQPENKWREYWREDVDETGNYRAGCVRCAWSNHINLGMLGRIVHRAVWGKEGILPAEDVISRMTCGFKDGEPQAVCGEYDRN